MTQSISQTSHMHAKRVLEVLRNAMAEVPKEYRMSVLSQIYLTIGKAYHRKDDADHS